MKGRVLVAGFSTRHVAQSAACAGYEVCAVDHFCDQDLSWYTKDRQRFSELADLPDAIHEICQRNTFDLIIVTSGAEDLCIPFPLCGTPQEKVARFLDKLDIQHFFETLKVPVPRLLSEEEYPAMIKPRRGAGGWRNAIVRDRAGFAAWENLNPGIPFVRQEIVEGIPASVCCVTNGSGARAIAANEQILRGDDKTSFSTWLEGVLSLSQLSHNINISLGRPPLGWDFPTFQWPRSNSTIIFNSALASFEFRWPRILCQSRTVT